MKRSRRAGVEAAAAEMAGRRNQSHGAKAVRGDRCRVCRCTNGDCMLCVERTGEPCHWVKSDLCSACLPLIEAPLKRVGLAAKVLEAFEECGFRCVGALLGDARDAYAAWGRVRAVKKLDVITDSQLEDAIWRVGHFVLEQLQRTDEGDPLADHDGRLAARLPELPTSRAQAKQPASAPVANGATPPCLTSTSTPGGAAFQQAQQAAEEAYRPLVPLEKLIPSPTNPRKHFDETEVAELSESIRAKGVIVPLVVRPAPAALLAAEKLKPGSEAYEIVDGEKRYRAAKLAELGRLPVVVRELADLQVLEIQLVTFLQRSGISPLEEAAHYRKLLDEHGLTIEDLAKKIGKAKTYVYARLKLTGLPEPARKALADGTIPASTAELIARIPADKLRAEAASRIIKGGNFQGRVGRYYHFDKGPMALRTAKAFIESDYMVELKQAPFSRDDAELLPVAGACTSCPKRTGNAKDLYPGSRADICTDPGCFRQKVEAHEERARARLQEEGKKVLAPNQAKKLFEHGRLKYDSGYVELSDTEWHGGRSVTYREALGEAAAELTVRAFDPSGQVRLLAPTAQAKSAMRKLRSKKGAATRAQPKPAKAAPDRFEIRKRAEHNAALALVQAGLAATKCLAIVLDKKSQQFLQLLAEVATARELDMGGDAEALAKRWGIQGSAREGHRAEFKPWQEWIATATMPQLLALIFDLHATDFITHGHWSHVKGVEDKILAFAGVEWKAFEKRAKTDLVAERKAAKQAAKKEAKDKNPATASSRGKSARAKLRKAHPEIDWDHSDAEDDA